jgi:hypothetical protein
MEEAADGRGPPTEGLAHALDSRTAAPMHDSHVVSLVHNQGHSTD